MDSTGEILRRARNERHLTLDEVAIRTRINRKYLAAIESGDRESIPGGFFYKSFARQYAMALTTDEDNVLDAVEQSLAAEEPVAPPPPDEEVLKALAIKAEENGSVPRGSPSAAVYAVLFVLAIAGTSGVYILWHRSQQAQAAAQEAARTVPQQRKEEAAHPTQAAPAPTQPAPVQPAPAQEGASQPGASQPSAAPPEASQPTEGQPPPQSKTPEQVIPAVPVPQPTSPATSPQPGVQPVPATNPDDKIALNVAAHEMTWFSVAADGKIVFSGVLQPGQSRVFAARENARLRIGNASGVDVTFNGKSMGVLGEPKQVVTLLFTPQTSEIVKPQPPATPPPQPPPQF